MKSYQPTFEDIPKEEIKVSSVGYEPSFEDIPQEKTEEESRGIDINQMPWFVRKAFEIAPSLQKPLRQAIPERLTGMGAGITHIGQGAKQAGLEAGEALGMFEPGTSDQYTAQKDAEREAFARSSAGRDPLSREITSQTEALPYMAALGPLGTEMGVIKKILAGTAAGGAAGATEYVPAGESRAINTAKGMAVGGGIPLVGATVGTVGKQIGRAFGDISPLEEAMAQAQQRAERALQANKEAKAASEMATKMSNPNKMQNVMEAKQAELATMPNGEPSNFPVVSSQESGAQVEIAEKAHEVAQKAAIEAKEQLESHLNNGSAHGQHNTSDINRKIDIIENHYSDRYKQLMKNLEDAHFQMPEQVMNDYEAELNKHLGAGRISVSDLGKLQEMEEPAKKEMSKELQEIMDKAPTDKDTNASDFLVKQKAFRDARYDASQRMKTANATERNEIKKALNDSKAMEDSIKNALDNGLGVYKPEFESINKGYSDIIFPLRSYNPVKSIRSGKETPKNFLNILGRKSAYVRTAKAQEALRQIVKSDPELMRNVIGQKYSVKLKGLHGYDESAQEYLEKMPKTQKLIQQHKEAVSRVPIAKNQLENAKNYHNSMIENEQKGFKAAEKEKKNIEDINIKRSKLEDEIKEFDKHIAELNKSSKKKDISLKQKMTFEKKLKEAKEKKEKAQSLLWKLGFGAAGIFGIPYGISSIGKGLIQSGENQ